MTTLIRVIAAVGGVSVAVSPVIAQDSVTVVAGDYAAGWFKRWLFGSDYRDLWTTPIRVPVLNIGTYAGGLTPVRTGGFGQTISLHFEGADQRRYVFRSIDKDLTRRLNEGLLGTFVEDIVQDQTSAYHPAAALVTSPLVQAAGVLAAAPEMYVMPDDPALGEFREAYAGMLGLMMENPDEGPDNTAGFAGSTRVSGSDRVLEDTEDSPRDWVDAEAFLRARLLDIYLGDRDRHKGQWKWARYREGNRRRWEVIAEDRDQPFARADGLILDLARTFFVRKLTKFSEGYSNLVGLTWNSWDLDRRFLAGVERPTWDTVAADLQARLTDEVIDNAVRKMPAPYYERNGPTLAAALRMRRDSLHVVAGRYYEMLAGYVDIHATDEDEIATIERHADGRVTVEVAVSAVAPPHFRRTFLPDETREIRLYLQGGEDEATVRGDGDRIIVRVIGGGDRDRLIDESAHAVYFYDGGNGTDFVRGSRTHVDTHDYDAPESPDFVHEAPPDWGHWLRPDILVGLAPDVGLLVGGGLIDEQFGFRRHPYKSRLHFVGGFAFGARQPTAVFLWEQRGIRRNLHFGFEAQTTGLEIIRFHGFGNGTVLAAPSAFYRVERVQSDVRLGWIWEPASAWTVTVGPRVSISNTDDDDVTLLTTLGSALYGAGTFGQVGMTGTVRWDRRNRVTAPTRGFVVSAEGTVYPNWFDVREVFSEVHGDAAAYVTFGPTLAVRAGGKKVFGTFPFQNAAYLGGRTTIRGFAEQRFAGDAVAFGNAELRVPVVPVRIIFPAQLGVHGVADGGRVFSEADGPGDDTWHAAFGGGVWLSVLDPANVLSVTVVRSSERTGVYFGSGFYF